MAAQKLPSQATGANIRSAIGNHADLLDDIALELISIISQIAEKLDADQVQALIDASGGGGGSMTGAEIRAALGVTTLSGSNTGDQDLSGIITSLQGKASQADLTTLNNAYSAYVTSNNAAVAGKVSQSVYDTFVSAYNTAIALKVDKIDGKGLSANDYTATDKGRVDTIPALTAAVAAATPFFQPETVSYLNRVKTAGDILTADEINAIDSFIVKGRNDGWLSTLKWVWAPFGGKLVGSLVNLIAVSGVPSSLFNTNFVEADYEKDLGFGTGATVNTTKWLDAGFVPGDLGITGDNVSFGVFAPMEVLTAGYYMGFANNPNTPTLSVLSYTVRAIQDTTGGIGSASGYAPCLQSVSYGAANVFNAYVNTVNSANSTNTIVTNKVIDTTNLSLFKSRTTYAGGKLCFAFMGTYMTPAQNKSFNSAVADLMVKTNRLKIDGGKGKFIGDSITNGAGVTAGVNRWSSVVASQLNIKEINYGVGSSQLRQNVPTATGLGIAGGFQRYLDMRALQGNTVFCMYGTNDMNVADATTNGDATLLADYRSKLTTMVNSWKAERMTVVLLSPPFNAVSSTNITKRNAWQQACLTVAKNTGSLFVDTETVFTDTANAAGFFPDNLHPDNTGHAMIANLCVSVVKGRTYRYLSLDFASIAAQSTATLTVAMLNTVVGQSVIIQPSTPTPGVIFMGYVSAADVVTVIATNITGAAIDPAAMYYRVEVILDL